MKILVTTKSGSKYKLDQEAMTFERLNSNADANVLMEDAVEIRGKLRQWPDITIGVGLYLLVDIEYPEVGQPWTYIRSTAVASIENL